MKTYAIIESGTIVNVVVASDEWVEKVKGTIVAVEISDTPGSPGIGWKYDGVSFYREEG